MYALKRSLIVTGCASMFILIFKPDDLVSVYTNETIITLGIGALMVDFILEQGRAGCVALLTYITFGGRCTFSGYNRSFSMWFFAVGCGYLFGIVFGWGLAGMWVGFALDECSRGTLLYFRWKSKKWMLRNLIRPIVKID